MTREELLCIIAEARADHLRSVDLAGSDISELPDEIGQLTELSSLSLRNNRVSSLPESIANLTNLRTLDLRDNGLAALPESIGNLENLWWLDVSDNCLECLPESIGRLTRLKTLFATGNVLASLPASIGQLGALWRLELATNELTWLPDSVCEVANLELLDVAQNKLVSLPDSIERLLYLRSLRLDANILRNLPESVCRLRNLKTLSVARNRLTSLPQSIGSLTQLELLDLSGNQLRQLPQSLCAMAKLPRLRLDDNPLEPALLSAYRGETRSLNSYLRSLVAETEPLYEAKLIFVGEGNVGKTTLLKALVGRENDQPREGEPTTHGVKIDICSLRLPHPVEAETHIQLNAWDFGGQEVYRATHQFFFSHRSLYVLVWEPRRGVGQCQVEDWLRLIRLRVGDDARVLVVSTHCRTGGRIARIDRPVLQRDFGTMIVGFYEVDSLVVDATTGTYVGVNELKDAIARAAAGLDQMGMSFNTRWRKARDDLLGLTEPRISYREFADVCTRHRLGHVDAETLALLMHDLGYIVHYGDDERMRDDVVLQPEWLTKAIGFVLEDRTTQEMNGILPDNRLTEVWRDHPFEGETRYDVHLYSFFLRLMEKYDVSYRLPDGVSSLIAQHVPQVRPELPWYPEEGSPPGLRQIEMVCSMDEDPPGLMPWMIVRTHDFAVGSEKTGDEGHRLHWERGTFLRYPPHGEAVVEKRDRELHICSRGVWPEYFSNVLQHILQKLIVDTWPGMDGRYRFTVPCPERRNGAACKGRFNIDALRRFLAEGDQSIRCQECGHQQAIAGLLFGFERPDLGEQLRGIEARLSGLESRIANYIMALMRAIATEAKSGPRLCTIEPVRKGRGKSAAQLFSRKVRLRLWCEAEGCQHPVVGRHPTRKRKLGEYEFAKPRLWFVEALPYFNFVLGLLKAAAPVAAPAMKMFLGASAPKDWDYEGHLALVAASIANLPDELALTESEKAGVSLAVSGPIERAGLLALHRLLDELDPNHEYLGLTRVATYTGDYRWLCRRHYAEWESQIPEDLSGGKP